MTFDSALADDLELRRGGVLLLSPAVGPTFGLTQKWAKSQDENMLPPALCVGQLK